MDQGEKRQAMIARTIFFLCLLTMAWADPFQPVGRWKLYHTDGSPLLVTLYPNHQARSNWQNGTKGHWRWVEGRLVMRWKDGWRDVVTLRDGRFEKLGYAPGNRDPLAPSNRTVAYKLGE